MRRTAAPVLAIFLLLLFSFFTPTYCQNNSNGNARGSRVSQPAKPALPLSLPLSEASVKFAVIGDTGTGSKQQHQIADFMTQYRTIFPFEFVLMMGDNLYGTETPADYKKKFQDVYQNMLDDKVKFY